MLIETHKHTRAWKRDEKNNWRQQQSIHNFCHFEYFNESTDEFNDGISKFRVWISSARHTFGRSIVCFNSKIKNKTVIFSVVDNFLFLFWHAHILVRSLYNREWWQQRVTISLRFFSTLDEIASQLQWTARSFSVAVIRFLEQISPKNEEHEDFDVFFIGRFSSGQLCLSVDVVFTHRLDMKKAPAKNREKQTENVVISHSSVWEKKLITFFFSNKIIQVVGRSRVGFIVEGQSRDRKSIN